MTCSDVRSIVYERAKGIRGELSFGTERDLEEVGYEFLMHSVAPGAGAGATATGGGRRSGLSSPYAMSLLNVSSMSFGALSGNAFRALNAAAAAGGFAHDTGEGGLTPYHLDGGGDVIWEIGSGYFDARVFGALAQFQRDRFRMAQYVPLDPAEGAGWVGGSSIVPRARSSPA